MAQGRSTLHLWWGNPELYHSKQWPYQDWNSLLLHWPHDWTKCFSPSSKYSYRIPSFGLTANQCWNILEIRPGGSIHSWPTELQWSTIWQTWSSGDLSTPNIPSWRCIKRIEHWTFLEFQMMASRSRVFEKGPMAKNPRRTWLYSPLRPWSVKEAIVTSIVTGMTEETPMNKLIKYYSSWNGLKLLLLMTMHHETLGSWDI